MPRYDFLGSHALVRRRVCRPARLCPPSDPARPSPLRAGRQLRIDFPGAIHHITSRGNERRIIYRDDRDRRHFLEILEEVVTVRRWILHAWVLMSNHYP